MTTPAIGQTTAATAPQSVETKELAQQVGSPKTFAEWFAGVKQGASNLWNTVTEQTAALAAKVPWAVDMGRKYAHEQLEANPSLAASLSAAGVTEKADQHKIVDLAIDLLAKPKDPEVLARRDALAKELGPKVADAALTIGREMGKRALLALGNLAKSMTTKSGPSANDNPAVPRESWNQLPPSPAKAPTGTPMTDTEFKKALTDIGGMLPKS